MGICRRTLVIGGILAAATTALAGCGSSASPTARSVLGIGERDFHITAPEHVAAGTFTLRVHNTGPDVHELFVVRTGSDRLPLRSDGLTVDEDRIAHETAVSVDAIQPGNSRDSRLHLAPGRYLLFCNMAGHFRGGMHTELVVS